MWLTAGPLLLTYVFVLLCIVHMLLCNTHLGACTKVLALVKQSSDTLAEYLVYGLWVCCMTIGFRV